MLPLHVGLLALNPLNLLAMAPPRFNTTDSRPHPQDHLWRAIRRHRPNSERECARRRRQIERGQLTAANGLAA